MADYLDGELPQDLRASLESHLAKCPECWVLVDETRKTIEIVQTHECHPLPAAVKSRLQNAIHEHWEKS
jgi:anti-sigma factor RsiW